jgi:acyl carrier protein
MNDRLFKIMSETLGVDPTALNEETSMENTPAWDSVAHLNLVLSLEEAFGQRFSPEEFMQMHSVPAIKRIFATHGVS